MLRKATMQDVSRIAEIIVFGKRVAYRPIFNNDVVSFFLWVIEDNLFARKFYENNGFIASGETCLIEEKIKGLNANKLSCKAKTFEVK